LLLVLFCGVCRAYTYFQVESNDFNVSAYDGSTGILQFQFYEKRDTTSIYTIGLKSIWEAPNGDLSTPMSVLPLSQWNAEMGPKVNNTQYWILTTGPTKPTPTSRFDLLTLNVSVPLGAADLNTSFPAAVIDVSITNYNWMDGNDSTQLVLSWFVQYQYNSPIPDSTINLKTKAGKTVDFDGAYFSVNTTAKNGNMSVDVSLELASSYTNASSSMSDVYVVYDHFDGDLLHDPQFGFGSGPGSSLLWIIIIVVVIIAILVIILIAVIGFVLVRRRRRAYDSF